MILADHWAPIVIAVISGAGTVLVTMVKIKGDKSASLPEAYQGLVQEMKSWTSTQLEQRDREIESLKHDVGELREAVRLWQGKFREAVHYIRSLRAASRDRNALPPVPESLREYIDE